MRNRIRGAVVALALAALAGLLTAAPAQATVTDYGRTEDSASWYDSAQTTTYTMHVAHKVTVDTAPQPDRWRYVSHGWCTKQVGPTGSSQSTPCNMDFFDAGLFVTIDSVSDAYAWRLTGPRDFECNKDSDCVFTGSWRDAPSGFNYIFARTPHIQFRFLASTGDHLTNVYNHCSNKSGLVTYTVWPTWCRTLSRV